MHQYFHSSGITDLDAIHKEAMYRLIDKKYPEESLIHLHPKYVKGISKDIPCEVTTVDRLRDEEDLKKDPDHEWILFSRIDPAYVHPGTGALTWKEKDAGSE